MEYEQPLSPSILQLTLLRICLNTPQHAREILSPRATMSSHPTTFKSQAISASFHYRPTRDELKTMRRLIKSPGSQPFRSKSKSRPAKYPHPTHPDDLITLFDWPRDVLNVPIRNGRKKEKFGYLLLRKVHERIAILVKDEIDQVDHDSRSEDKSQSETEFSQRLTNKEEEEEEEDFDEESDGHGDEKDGIGLDSKGPSRNSSEQWVTIKKEEEEEDAGRHGIRDGDGHGHGHGNGDQNPIQTWSGPRVTVKQEQVDIDTDKPAGTPTATIAPEIELNSESENKQFAEPANNGFAFPRLSWPSVNQTIIFISIFAGICQSLSDPFAVMLSHLASWVPYLISLCIKLHDPIPLLMEFVSKLWSPWSQAVLGNLGKQVQVWLRDFWACAMTKNDVGNTGETAASDTSTSSISTKSVPYTATTVTTLTTTTTTTETVIQTLPTPAATVTKTRYRVTTVTAPPTQTPMQHPDHQSDCSFACVSDCQRWKFALAIAVILAAVGCWWSYKSWARRQRVSQSCKYLGTLPGFEGSKSLLTCCDSAQCLESSTKRICSRF